MISAAITLAIAVVTGWFACSPMIDFRAVSQTSGTIANGSCTESETWLRIRIQ